MDKYYRKGLNLEEGTKLMGKCISEVQRRLVLNSPKFVVKIVDKNGSRLLDVSQFIDKIDTTPITTSNFLTSSSNINNNAAISMKD